MRHETGRSAVSARTARPRRWRRLAKPPAVVAQRRARRMERERLFQVDTPVRSQLALSRVATALAAVSVGALAVGALAVGRLAIGTLRMKRGTIARLRIDELEVGRLRVRELVTEEAPED